MDKNEFSIWASAMQTYFPRYNLLPNEAALELWYRELEDVPYAVACASLRKWVSTEKWPPSIAEIREITAELVNGKAPDWGEGWAEVQKAIRRYGWCREKEALDSLSPASRQAAERIGWRDICNSENPETLRAQFRQIYQAETQRQHKDACLPESVKKMIAGIGNSTTAALPVRGNDKWK